MPQEPKNYIIVDENGRKWNECAFASLNKGVYTEAGAIKFLFKAVDDLFHKDQTHPTNKFYKNSRVAKLPKAYIDRLNVLKQLDNLKDFESMIYDVTKYPNKQGLTVMI